MVKTIGVSKKEEMQSPDPLVQKEKGGRF